MTTTKGVCDDLDGVAGNPGCRVVWRHDLIHHGRTWTDRQFAEDFEVEFVQRGIVVARQRYVGAVGSLYFGGSPRVYFGWLPHPAATPRTASGDAVVVAKVVCRGRCDRRVLPGFGAAVGLWTTSALVTLMSLARARLARIRDR